MTQELPKTGRFKGPKEWDWLPGYNLGKFADDSVAGLIVTILLVPQALAYALLAGLPAQMGIYAAILPLAVYAFVGSSRYLSVGPTAVISLMTAIAISNVPEAERMVAAAALAVMTGAVLFILGLLRGGYIMNFVARPVVSAYVTGAAILIMFSQLKHVLGVPASGNTVLELAHSLLQGLQGINAITLYIGLATIAFLWAMNTYFAYVIVKAGVPAKLARLLARLSAFAAVFITTVIAAQFELFDRYNVAIVGDIPAGLPILTLPIAPLETYTSLFQAAVLIGLVGFIDGMSTAQTLAARSRTRIQANREMRALAISNFASGISGGYPVNGSMSRSAVNYSAGAKTPIASLLAAVMMCVTALFLTSLLYYLPLATLAALIIFSCVGLLDFRHIWRTWVYSRADGLTAILTFISVLVFGVEFGVVAGVVLSMLLHIQSTLRPHAVVVGRVSGTEQYRDVTRYDTEDSGNVVTLRIDESLYYANARFLEDRVAEVLSSRPAMTDMILMCPAVNRIDASALNSLMSINNRLDNAGVKLHMSELHGHVTDRLKRSTFFEKLSGTVFFSQHEAMETLRAEPDWALYSDHVDMH